MERKPKLILVAPSLDGGDLGEVFSIFKLIEAMTGHAELTVLSSSRNPKVPLSEQLPNVRVVTWPEPEILYTRFERFNAMAKPWLPIFARKVRKWIKTATRRGERFDAAHQILPQAMRYATPLKGLGIPYAVGPLGGGLETPAAFRDEVGSGGLVSRLRMLDSLRLRYDWTLRKSYADADIIFGVAPYVQDKLQAASIPIREFQPLLERGQDLLPEERVHNDEPGRLELLHVGRTVRTKGLRDAVRAMATLKDLPGIRLTSAGDGPDLAACRAEAEALGISDRINFLGRVPRERVEQLYASADVFCFPSFREPMGGVFFEAMAHGLPIVTAAYGGPDFIVDDTSGIRIDVADPDQFAADIADAVRDLANNPQKRLQLGRGARQRLISFGTWEDKAKHLISCYRRMAEAGTGGGVADGR